MRQWFFIFFLTFSLVGCSLFGNKEEDDEGPFKGMSAAALYKEAKEAVTSSQYTSASKRLEALGAMYPFSNQAESAALLLIYCYYQDEQYVAAAAEAAQFVHLYPRAKQVDYAYYMKGLANFQQLRSVLGNVIPMDESWRDPGTQQQAYTDFSNFIERFPHSPYYQDALRRLLYLRNQFAQRELNNAEFYYERDMYVAAAGRASYLVQHYPQAPSVEKALKIMVLSYRKLGLKEAALDAEKVYLATFHHAIRT